MIFIIVTAVSYEYALRQGWKLYAVYEKRYAV